jgi:hypothetical protein
MAQRRRRSLESERRVRGGGTLAGDSAKPRAPAGGGDPAHRMASEDGARVGPAPGAVVTGTLRGRPADAVLTGGCVALDVADAVTGWSAARRVDGLSARSCRGSGPPPASRDRRAASAMAASAPGLTLWSVCFPGLRVCTIFLRRGNSQSGVVPRRTPRQLHYLSRPSPMGIAPTSAHPLTYPHTGVLNVRALSSWSGAPSSWDRFRVPTPLPKPHFRASMTSGARRGLQDSAPTTSKRSMAQRSGTTSPTRQSVLAAPMVRAAHLPRCGLVLAGVCVWWVRRRLA